MSQVLTPLYSQRAHLCSLPIPTTTPHQGNADSPSLGNSIPCKSLWFRILSKAFHQINKQKHNSLHPAPFSFKCLKYCPPKKSLFWVLSDPGHMQGKEMRRIPQGKFGSLSITETPFMILYLPSPNIHSSLKPRQSTVSWLEQSFISPLKHPVILSWASFLLS